LTGIFLFGLPILNRIESPTAAVILRLYSDNGIDSALADSSTPAIAANSLVPCYSTGLPVSVVPGRLLRLPL
jgi:hypothetical protein